MDSVFGIPIDLAGNLGSAGLVALFVVAILLGKLVPSAVMRNAQQLFELRIAEKDKEASVWREAYDKSESARAVLAEQAHTSVELAETLTKLLERVAPEALPQKGAKL